MANDNEKPEPQVDEGAAESKARGGVVALPAIISLAKVYDLDAAAFVYTFKAVAMPHPHSDPEFVSCCLVAQSHGLNPLTKEIYFMKTKAGGIQPIVSVDGWIKKCNEHPQFDGMEFEDIFSDGKISAVRCTIHRKDRTRPTAVTEYMAECAGSTGPWKSHPSRMLRHRALMQCARIAFGFAGIMDRDEFDQWSARDVTPDATPARAPTTTTKRTAISLADLPSISPKPTATATSAEVDQAALIREIEAALIKDPENAGQIEGDYSERIKAMDTDGREVVIAAIIEARRMADQLAVPAE